MEYRKTGTGPLLIYVSGIDGTGQFFIKQIPELESQFTVVTFTSRTEPPFGYDDLTADILSIMEQEHCEKAHIVAESFGGTVGLSFALKHPERIEQLILVNTFPYFRKRIRLKLAKLLLPLAFLSIVRNLRNVALKPLLLNEMVEPAAIDHLFTHSWSHGKSTYRQRLRLLENFDVRNQLEAIEIPVLIVAGEKDRLVPSPKEAQWMAKRIKNARVEILPRLGHACLLARTCSLSGLLGFASLTR